jgi:hypothetical protein
MTTRDLALKLQGFFELAGPAQSLDARQTETLRKWVEKTVVEEDSPALDSLKIK